MGWHGPEEVQERAGPADQPGDRPPARHLQEPAVSTINRRRRLVLTLNLVTIAGLFFAMMALMSHGGFVAAEWMMLAAYGVTLPWLSIGLWNGTIGFLLDRRYADRAATVVTPALGRISGREAITARTAIIMPLRNEDPAASLARLRGLQRTLAAGPWADRFDYFVLSDTDRPDIASREEALVARWKNEVRNLPLTYHRRTENTGYKAGNIAEFLDRHGKTHDFFLPLDADSVMGAEAVQRMVRVMQAAPEIGILQSLVTGMPSRTFFTRAFQFGMRHGMRSYTLGSAWWQADCGPNWGHNVLIRTAPFHAHCMMPVLPGRGPLSGHILSHDQLEAAMMRRAGYEVRVIAEESDSHEENPPSLADFIRRELRWCNGNMQYLRLLGLKGLAPVSRIQLYLAIQMYLAAPAWMIFILTSAGLVAFPDQFSGAPLWTGLAFFALLMTLNLMPKLMGLAQVLRREERTLSYGGRRRVMISGFAEIAISMLMAPILAFALSLFLVGLLFGKRAGWNAQQRSRERLEWSEAAAVLWPQTLAGAALTVWLAVIAPWALAFAAPVLLSLSFAIPIAVLTAHPALGRWSLARGLFDIPEDRSREVATPATALQADIA